MLVVCSSPPEYPHAHLCEACDLVWFHDPSLLSDAPAHDAAHHCPACGAEVRLVNVLHTRAMYRHRGANPFL